MSNFESMRKKHRKDSMKSLSFLIFLLLLFIYYDYFTSIFINAIENPDELFSIEEQSWVKFLSVIVIPLVSYFLGILTIAKRDLYYDIDNIFFKRRKEIDKFICIEMLNFRTGLNSSEAAKVKKLKELVKKQGTSRLLMQLFYKYIERDEVVNPQLKNHAFIYWGDYFSSITFIFFGCCTLIVFIILTIKDASLPTFRLVLFLIVILITALNFRSIFRGKVAKRLFEIPTTQISQIHRNAEQELLNELRAENFRIER